MPSRSYGQYCALARALDAVGDRWSLLIVRNLLLGPLRWSELRDGLPGIAKNLLSARLSALAEAGVIARAGDVYRLTPCGAELEPALFALGDWGERHLFGPRRPGEVVRLRYLMTSIRRRLRPSPHSGWVEFKIDGAVYSVRLGQEPTVVQGAGRAKTAVETNFVGFGKLIFDRQPVVELVQAGHIAVRGDTALIQAFVAALPSS